jgi:streptogramin lyase
MMAPPLLGLLGALAGAACGEAPTGGGASDPIGVVRFDLTTAPTDARCAVITATPAVGAVVTRQLSLSPGQTAVFNLTGVPLGLVTFNEKVFTVACPVPAATVATWIADPVTATVEMGLILKIDFGLRRASDAAIVVAHSNFPDLPNAITEFPFGVNNGAIVGGPDGNLWFTDRNEQSFGRLTPAGAATLFPLASGASSPAGIAAGPDGNLWVTISGTRSILRLMPTGVQATFATPTANPGAMGIVAARDGNLWFTENLANQIGRITPAGVVTEFTVPTAASGPAQIALGADGNLWFTERSAGKIGRVTTAGVFAEFAIPSAASSPLGIAAGPDGALWFLETSGRKLGRITTAGVVTAEFAIPAPARTPIGITAGPDGNLWFTEANEGGSSVVRATTAGVFTLFPTPTTSALAGGIAVGADGNLWFTEFGGIGRIRTL